MPYPTFTRLRQTPIPSLNITVEEYRHITTGARHLHLVADDDNNAFLVAFLTVPQDSTGVAHILEHTTLCGSRRYPVRDPFFMMTRRSLNTFMNAFTSSDWTAYPFASQNAKDFDNLLQVYLDAVFFPNLNELDFAQEGHRVEFATPDDPNTPLVYKGIVFNEMKGAMSSPLQNLWKQVCTHLFPTTTYHYNSGGDPQVIPQLTHAELRAFHASHYHPSNAVFMTYGDRPAAGHQQFFEECALQHFQALTLDWHIPDEQRYSAPQQVVTTYAVTEQETTVDKTHIVVAWLLGHSASSRDIMNAHLITGLLLDNSASPLRHALETSPLGTGPSPICGLDDNTREATFVAGIEGSNPEQAAAVENLILQVLTTVADNGVPIEQVEAVLHQIELSQREISGDGLPYGLHLLVNVLPSLLHGGDPVETLDIDPVLSALRADCHNPQFVPTLIRQLLLDNPHRVRVVMAPDADLAKQRLAQEMAQLAELRASLKTEDCQKIIAQTQALQARQQRQDDPSILPKVGLADVAPDLKIPEGNTQVIAGSPTTWFARGTNGLVYQAVAIDLPALDTELLDVLPYFCECLTEVGCHGKNYLETAKWQAAISGGIHARISLRGSVSDSYSGRALFSLSSKALRRNHVHLTELVRVTLETARFDELPRLRELIGQLRADYDNSITQRGHHLAMTAASRCLNLVGYLSNRWYGCVGLHALRSVDDSLEDEAVLSEFADHLSKIRDKLLAVPQQWVVIGESEAQTEILEALNAYHPSRNSLDKQETSLLNYDGIKTHLTQKRIVREAWSTSTQVNFCAQVYATVPSGHPDAPALVVLGDFLRNGYLHTALREQGGAYGGGANYDGDTGAFRFYSYRDPRLLETLADFSRARDWLHETRHEARMLEEAILGVVSRIDRPGSPAGEALTAFFNGLHGRSPQRRREFRQRILAVTLADLQRVCTTYLRPENAHIAVLSDAKTLDKVPELDLMRETL